MYRDKDVLNSFAKIAADEFLGKNQVSLNTTLKKIASEESLTPHQIEYVAGQSNLYAWNRLFAADKSASYDFPLAKSAEVIKDLQIKPQNDTVNEADLDYLSPPKSTKVASFDPLKAMGFLPENLEKSATEVKREVKRELQVRLEKTAAFKEELERQIMVVQTEIENEQERFIKAAKQMILDQPDSDKPATLEKIAEFIACCGDHDRGRDLIKKLAFVMKRQNIIKEADLKAPEQYISKNTPARIVNGKHALYISIKTIFDKQDYASNLINRHEIVDSSLPMIREKIREL